MEGTPLGFGVMVDDQLKYAPHLLPVRYIPTLLLSPTNPGDLILTVMKEVARS